MQDNKYVCNTEVRKFINQISYEIKRTVENDGRNFVIKSETHNTE